MLIFVCIIPGQLDKHGKPNENTPKEWLNSYVDYAAIKPKEEPVDDCEATIKKRKERSATPEAAVADGEVTSEKKKKKKKRKLDQEEASEEPVVVKQEVEEEDSPVSY